MKNYAVVTGASSGIGAATAKLLAANGFHVIAAARRVDRLEALAKSDSNIEIVESVRPTGLQKCAGRDGDEVRYLVAKVSETKRQT